jgi:hypothetical protein
VTRRAKKQGDVVPAKGASAQPTPKLRCWQDLDKDLHLACDRAGGQQLLEAVTRLWPSDTPASTMLRMSDEPFDEKRNPMGFKGVRRVFARLRLERVDDPAQVRFIQAHARDDETAEILVSPTYAPELVDACRQMAEGDGDFAIGLGRRRRWKMETADRASGDVWFWGAAAFAPNTFHPGRSE